VVAHENITERRLAEGTRDRLAAVVEATTDLIGFSDPSGRVLFLNRAARNALGVDPQEDVTGTFLTELVPNPASHPTLTEGIPTAIRQGSWSGDVVLVSRRGEEVLVSQVVLAHKTGAGALEYLSTIMRDITAQRRLEAQVFQSQKMETVGKLAGGIAHEFNSILTAIIGQSEILLSDLPPGDPLFKNATEIRKSTERASTLTRQLLAYGRKQNLQPEILELNSILTAIEKPIRGLIGRHTDLRINPAAGLKPAKADA
jgi:PAS domain S-box-containing protein